MRVTVDEPRQQRETTEIEHRAVTRRGVRHDGRDAPLLDHHRAVAPRRPAAAVDERRAAQDDAAGQMRPFRYERLAEIFPSRSVRMSQPSTS